MACDQASTCLLSKCNPNSKLSCLTETNCSAHDVRIMDLKLVFLAHSMSDTKAFCWKYISLFYFTGLR